MYLKQNILCLKYNLLRKIAVNKMIKIDWSVGLSRLRWFQFSARFNTGTIPANRWRGCFWQLTLQRKEFSLSFFQNRVSASQVFPLTGPVLYFCLPGV